MSAQTITLTNTGLNPLTFTNVTFTTPAGIVHEANLVNFPAGPKRFTGTVFTTSATLVRGESIQLDIDYFHTTATTGTISGSVVANCQGGISSTINTSIQVHQTGTVLVPATVEYVHDVLPYGTIIMWSGLVANIPNGWAFCDGTNGTPDLRNKFIISAHSDDSGVAKTTITGSPTLTGGTKDAVLVSHNHNITDPGHIHNVAYGIGSEANINGGPSLQGASYTISTELATTGITLNNSGESETNKNLPPYFALAYIMKTTNQTNTQLY